MKRKRQNEILPHYNFLKKNRKGQVAIFVIIAVVVLAVVAGYFLLTGDESVDEEKTYAPNVEGVKESIQDCVDDASLPGVLLLGLGGGKISLVENLEDIESKDYYSGSVNTMPSLEDIGAEYSKYIGDSLVICSEGFSDFPELEIKARDPEVETTIGEGFILTSFTYPVSVNQLGDSSVSVIEEYENIEIPVRLNLIYESVNEIVEEQIKLESGEVCLSCLFEIAERNDLYVESGDDGQEGTIFIITDKNSLINNEEFIFIFTGK
jgi:hypothetical protein